MRRLVGIVGIVAMLLWPKLAMAQSWTAPRTWATSELVTAALMNTHVRDNLIVLRAGGIAVTSQAIGDILCASSTTQFARLADVATGQVLTSGGVGACPSYSATLPTAVQDNITRLGTLAVQLLARGTASATSSMLWGDATRVGALYWDTATLGIGTTSNHPFIFFVNGGAAAITLPTAGGLQIGTDVLLSRGSANRLDLASGDSLNLVGGNLTVTGLATVSADLRIGTTTIEGQRLTVVGTADQRLVVFEATADMGVVMKVSNAAADEKYWQFLATTTSFALRTTPDNFSTATNVFSVVRSGASPISFAFNTELASDLIPDADNTYDLGSATLAWDRVFLADGSVSAPSISPGDETDTGIFFTDPSVSFAAVKFAADGVLVASAYLRTGIFTRTFELESAALGTGAKTGMVVSIGRNTSGGTAPGILDMYDKAGTSNKIWVDTTGDVRTATAAPEEDGTPSDTSGTVLGDQSSWWEAKEVLGPADPKAALQAVLTTPVYDFRFKATGYLDPDGRPPMFTGVVGYDRHDWFLKNVGPQQLPALNEINAIGYLVLSVQELARRLEALEAQP